MLVNVYIENFTLVERLILDLPNQLSVITGETGAGKSIWIDAIGVALGNRADPSVIREGQLRCEISLCFDVSKNQLAQQWLKDHELAAEPAECIIRRLISRDGPSRNTINGRPVPQHLVRELGQLLLIIHSQHQNQSLLKTEGQQQQFDHFAKNKCYLLEIAELYKEWKNLKEQMNILQTKLPNKTAELELLNFQMNELEEIDLREQEWEQLTQQHQQLHHAEELCEQLAVAHDFLAENEQASAIGLLYRAQAQFNPKYQDPKIVEIKQLLEKALVYLQEANHELNSYRENLDLSPESLAQIEQRISKIHALARKHQVKPEALISIKESFSLKIKELENIDLQLTELQKKQNQLLIHYQQVAAKLTQSRLLAAKILNEKMTAMMQQLGMVGGYFEISLEPVDGPISQNGAERVHFTVSTNPGQPLQPLQKIVSGGELSRLHLALQVITAQKDQATTLIFDEVDVGIGGKTAAMVGQLLKELATHTQVLCITHLPQVAAQGNQHFKVNKKTINNHTISEIQQLNQLDRIEELARMLSGATVTEQTRAHAVELLVNS